MDILGDDWLVYFKNVSCKRQGKAEYLQIKRNKTHDIQRQPMILVWALGWENNCQKGYYRDSWQALNSDSILNNTGLVWC